MRQSLRNLFFSSTLMTLTSGNIMGQCCPVSFVVTDPILCYGDRGLLSYQFPDPLPSSCYGSIYVVPLGIQCGNTWIPATGWQQSGYPGSTEYWLYHCSYPAPQGGTVDVIDTLTYTWPVLPCQVSLTTLGSTPVSSPGCADGTATFQVNTNACGQVQMHVSDPGAYYYLNGECCYGGFFGDGPASALNGDVIKLVNLSEGQVTITLEVSNAIYGGCIPGCSAQSTISIGSNACHTPIEFSQVQEADGYGCYSNVDVIWEEVEFFSTVYDWTGNGLHLYYPCHRKAKFIHENGLSIPAYGDTAMIENLIDTTTILLPSGTYTVLWENGSCSGTEQLLVGPACALNVTNTSVTNANPPECWDGEVSVSALTNACSGFDARLRQLDSTLIGTTHADTSGQTIAVYVPAPGSYLLQVSTSPAGCDAWIPVSVGCGGPPGGSVAVAVRAFLEGPFDPSVGTMKDSLRVLGLLPANEPFTALGYGHTVGGGGEIIHPGVLDVSGAQAIVDWVLVELRDVVQPGLRMHSRSALLRRDGHIVDMDGISAVTFSATPGDYHVAIRHRNHLGVMSAQPVALSSSPAQIDFTSFGTLTYGTLATKTVGGQQVLWSGDVNFDGQVKYTGEDNDRDPVLLSVGGSVPTQIVAGYLNSDVDMDGTARYTGEGNDRDPILVTVGGSVPTNVRVEQLP